MQESLKLLISIVTHSDPTVRYTRFRRLIDTGVEEKDFPDGDREVFTFIKEYVRKRSAVPSSEIVQLETGAIASNCAEDDDASFSYWLDAFGIARVRKVLFDYSTVFHEMALSGQVVGVGELYQEFGTVLRSLTGKKEVFELLPLMEEAVEQHNMIRSGTVELGIPLGFPSLDAIMGGAQKGDLIVLAGQQGTGKSFVLCKSAQHAAEAGKKVLFISMEMTALQMARRVASLGSSINGMALRLGRLPPWGLEPVLAYIEKWKALPRDRFMLIEGNMGLSVTDIMFKVQEYRPDVLYVDGMYMLKPSTGSANRQRWELVMNAVEELKQLALTESLPVVVSTQFAKKGVKDGMEGIGYSYSIAQAASVGLSIENMDNNEDTGQCTDTTIYKMLRVLKGREGENGSIRLKYDMYRSTIEEDGVIEGFVLPVFSGDEQTDSTLNESSIEDIL